MVNHAAGSQSREGIRPILQTIERDLGPTTSSTTFLPRRPGRAGRDGARDAPGLDDAAPRGLPVSGQPVAWRSFASGGAPRGWWASIGAAGTGWGGRPAPSERRPSTSTDVHVSTPPTLRDADASHLDRLVIETMRLLGPTPYVAATSSWKSASSPFPPPTSSPHTWPCWRI